MTPRTASEAMRAALERLAKHGHVVDRKRIHAQGCEPCIAREALAAADALPALDVADEGLVEAMAGAVFAAAKPIWAWEQASAQVRGYCLNEARGALDAANAYRKPATCACSMHDATTDPTCSFCGRAKRGP